MRRLYAAGAPKPPNPPIVEVDCPKKREFKFPTGLSKFVWFKILLKFSENVRL